MWLPMRRCVVPGDTWICGRGWALSWAVIYAPQNRLTNPAGVEIAMRTITQATDARGPIGNGSDQRG